MSNVRTLRTSHVIYKCMHCGAAVAIETPFFIDHSKVLNLAFGADFERQMQTGITPYRPHPCESGITGVAQLVAIRDD